MEFVTVHLCTTLSVHLSLEVFIRTDRVLPWKKQIINIAFYKIKNLQCGAYHKSCISMLFILLPQITPSVSLRNARWTGALRGLEGEERLQGGRREEGKGMLTRALCTALCDHPARGWKPEDGAGYIWPARSFWKFKRFYTQIKISGFSWEIVGIGHPQPAFLHGKTIGWKKKQLTL